MTPLEAVARAICEETVSANKEFVLERLYWTRISRAAIQALIDNVSEEMEDAGNEEIYCADSPTDLPHSQTIFKVMLAAALNEEKK